MLYKTSNISFADEDYISHNNVTLNAYRVFANQCKALKYNCLVANYIRNDVQMHNA